MWSDVQKKFVDNSLGLKFADGLLDCYYDLSQGNTVMVHSCRLSEARLA